MGGAGRNRSTELFGLFNGKWIDLDGDGRIRRVEARRGGPFTDAAPTTRTGLPLHFDNQSVFRERIYLDQGDPNVCTTRSP